MLRRVLVVDDQAEIREVVRIVLEDEGYAVVEAENGAAALLQLAKHDPALVLLDMRMPVLDGWGFMRQYRALPGSQVPVVVMTAAENPRAWAAEVGANAVLAKPFDVDQLLAIVASYCPPPSVPA